MASYFGLLPKISPINLVLLMHGLSEPYNHSHIMSFYEFRRKNKYLAYKLEKYLSIYLCDFYIEY